MIYCPTGTIVRLLIPGTLILALSNPSKPSSSEQLTVTNPPSFPLGGDVEIFNFSSLENAWKNASLPSEREHVTPYLFDTKKFKVMNYGNKKNQSNIRYVVDRYEDLLLVKKIFSKISKRPILMQDILQLFDQEESLFEINKNIDRDEGYKKSLKEDAKAHDVCEK